MEKQLQEVDIPEEEEQKVRRDFEKQEAELLRLQRRKIGADDFELLTVIGRGAFGEVGLLSLPA